MKNNLHIITGASRGLGFEIAKHLAENGDTVINLSRSQVIGPLSIHNFNIDLAANFSAQAVWSEILKIQPLEQFYQVSLINNAGMIAPIGAAEKIDEDQIKQNIAVNFTAPILIGAEFLRVTKAHQGPRVLFNVSSGVAKSPKSHWSVYSAAKAGLEAFSTAVYKEQDDPSLTKVIIFNPGIMDTEMQAQLRTSSEADFPELKRFIDYKHNGDLRDPALVGRLAAEVILGKKEHRPLRVSVEDLIAAGSG